jgi:hypothetical protein
MRHSKAEKAQTHERIVAVASKRFREEGLARSQAILTYCALVGAIGAHADSATLHCHSAWRCRP